MVSVLKSGCGNQKKTGQPDPQTLEAAKRVIRYLKSTKALKLMYGGGEKRGFEAYSDADGTTQDHRHAICWNALPSSGGLVVPTPRTYLV